MYVIFRPRASPPGKTAAAGAGPRRPERAILAGPTMRHNVAKAGAIAGRKRALAGRKTPDGARDAMWEQMA